MASVETNTVFWYKVLPRRNYAACFLINCCPLVKEVVWPWLKWPTFNSRLHWSSRWLPFSEGPVMVATKQKVKFCQNTVIGCCLNQWCCCHDCGGWAGLRSECEHWQCGAWAACGLTVGQGHLLLIRVLQLRFLVN